jgi:hypothetical protein
VLSGLCPVPTIGMLTVRGSVDTDRERSVQGLSPDPWCAVQPRGDA